jgi:tetraacyldisaccharide 4'-kinase
LLREPLSALRRAGAIVITRSDEVREGELERIELEVRRWNPHAPVYRASHEQIAVCVEEQRRPMEWLRGRCLFAFCGIAEPGSFLGRLSQIGTLIGSREFGDHHAYSEPELRELDAQAAASGAELMLTTEKDWAKLAGMPAARSTRTPMGRVQMAVRFAGDGHDRLVEQILSACSAKSAGSPSSSSAPAV